MRIINQNTFDKWHIPDESVQAIISSPPYWNKRIYDIPDIVIGGSEKCEHEFINECKYRKESNRKHTKRGEFKSKDTFLCKKCGAWKGQYGNEKHPDMYIQNTLLWLIEAFRVLKKDGVLFLNIGDSYFNKCKQLIPQKIAIEMCELGWILRNDIIWKKTSCVPESVSDRFSSKTESILFFSKSLLYKSFLNNVKEEMSEVSIKRYKGNFFQKKFEGTSNEKSRERILKDISEGNTAIKNPGDVWEYPASCKKLSHIAMWNEDLVKRMVLFSTEKNDTVLDPFCGSSTTIVEAEKLFRNGIGFDLGYFEDSKQRMSIIHKFFKK